MWLVANKGIHLGFYRDNGKNGNYYFIVRYILGLLYSREEGVIVRNKGVT